MPETSPTLTRRSGRARKPTEKGGATAAAANPKARIGKGGKAAPKGDKKPKKKAASKGAAASSAPSAHKAAKPSSKSKGKGGGASASNATKATDMMDLGSWPRPYCDLLCAFCTSAKPESAR